jgi:hypothetical protein
MKMLRTKTFIAFGFYRIGLGIILLIILFAVNGGNLSTGILLDSTSSSTALLNTMDCLVANPTLLNFIPSLR